MWAICCCCLIQAHQAYALHPTQFSVSQKPEFDRLQMADFCSQNLAKPKTCLPAVEAKAKFIKFEFGIRKQTAPNWKTVHLHLLSLHW